MEQGAQLHQAKGGRPGLSSTVSTPGLPSLDNHYPLYQKDRQSFEVLQHAKVSGLRNNSDSMQMCLAALEITWFLLAVISSVCALKTYGVCAA